MDQIDLLPDYMKIVYKFVMNIYEDFEREAEKQDKSFAVPYYREAVSPTSIYQHIFKLLKLNSFVLSF